MKKFLVLFIVVLGALAGLNFYSMKIIKDTHTDIITYLKDSKVDIKSEQFIGGIFKSSSEFDINVKSLDFFEDLPEIFNNDLIEGKLHIDYHHSALSFLNGFDADADFEIDDKNILTNFFDNKKIFKMSYKGIKKDSNVNIIGEIAPLKIQEESSEFKASNVYFKFTLAPKDNQLLLKDLKFDVDFLKISSDNLNFIDFKDISLGYSSKNGVTINDFIYGSDFMSKFKLSIGNIDAMLQSDKVSANNIEIDSASDINVQDIISSNGIIKIGEVIYGDSKIVNFVLDSLVDGISKDSYIKFLEATDKLSYEDSIEIIDFSMASLDMLSNNNIGIKINKLGFESPNGGKFNFDLDSRLNKINAMDIQMELDKINLNGNLSFDSKIISYIQEKFDFDLSHDIDKFIKAGALIKKNDSINASFKIVGDDVIINDTVKLSEL